MMVPAPRCPTRPATLASLPQRGVDVVARMHQRRKVDFRTGRLDSLRQYSNAMAQARNRKTRRQLWDDLLLNLARDQVPERPGRREPRAVKRRPKPYPLLTRPRMSSIQWECDLFERPFCEPLEAMGWHWTEGDIGGQPTDLLTGRVRVPA